MQNPGRNSVNQLIGTGIIVTSQKREILLGKRLNAYRAGTYGLPGGRLEVGEPLLDSVKRELLEETSLTGISFKFLGVVREWQGLHDFIHFGYICTKYSGVPKDMESEKCEGWGWYVLADLPHPILKGHAGVIDLYQEYSRKQPPYIKDITRED